MTENAKHKAKVKSKKAKVKRQKNLMKRRNFLKQTSMIGLVAGLSPGIVLSETESAKTDDRKFWVDTLPKLPIRFYRI